MALQNIEVWNKYYHYGAISSIDEREKTFLCFPFINIILTCSIIHMMEELPGHFKPSCHSYHGALSMLYRKGLKCKRIKATMLMLVERYTTFHYAAYRNAGPRLELDLQTNSALISHVHTSNRGKSLHPDTQHLGWFLCLNFPIWLTS